MPSSSGRQHRFMEMIAHDPKAARRVGVPQSVGRDFAAADAGRRFAQGGRTKNDDDAHIEQPMGLAVAPKSLTLKQAEQQARDYDDATANRQWNVRTPDPFQRQYNPEMKFAAGGQVDDDDLSWLFDDKAFGDDTDIGSVAASEKPVKMGEGGYAKPRTVKIPGHGEIAADPIPSIERASDNYMRFTGRQPLQPIDRYPTYDVDTARRVAEAYDQMKHDPTDPRVKRAYDAMIEETLGQYRALKDQGLEFRFNPPGVDPYARSPSLGYLDMRDKGLLHVFPTESGFGSLADFDPSSNPLLKRVGRIGDLPDATANDAFRTVHDAFGHFGPGNPFFRDKGEERAWLNHGRMYSPDALPAVTSETRGQNSWVNHGPFAETNKTASGADTTYADQKTGLMPEWTWREGFGEGGGVHLPKRHLQFRTDLDQFFGNNSRDAGQLVRDHAENTGREALSIGDQSGYSPIVRGDTRGVDFPAFMPSFVRDHVRSGEDFFTVHSHPVAPDLGDVNPRTHPSVNDLRGLLHFAPDLQHMLIEGAGAPNSRLMIEPGKSIEPIVQARNMMQYRKQETPEALGRWEDFNSAVGLPPRDSGLYSLIANDKMASLGLPISMDARGELVNGMKYQDLLPDLKGYLAKHDAMPFYEGGRA